MDIASTFDATPFRHSDPKYKCCCNHMHVKQGVRIMLVLAIIGVAISVLTFILDISTLTWYATAWQGFMVVLGVVMTFCLFWAMKKENEKFLLPYLAYIAFSVLVSSVLFVFSLWSLIDPRSEPARIASHFIMTNSNGTMVEQESNVDGIRVVSSFGLLFSVIGIALSLWVGYVVYKYYLYLGDMKRARNPQNVVHHEISTLKKEIK